MVVPPAGDFVLHDATRKLVLFSGGSGITPCISIIKSALVTTARQIRLIYANREASRCTDTDLSKVVGLTIFEAFPELADTKAPDLFYEVATKREARRLGVVRYADENVKRGAYDAKAFPMPQNCFGVLFENLSDQPR